MIGGIIRQRVLLFTEHNAEIIAGFIVGFAFRHAAPIDQDKWRAISDSCLTHQCLSIQQEAKQIKILHCDYLADFLEWRRPVEEMDLQECSLDTIWPCPYSISRICSQIQLCLEHFLVVGWCMDVSRNLPSLRLGLALRNGHSRNLLDDYAWRSLPILRWARARFEKGSLPSMILGCKTDFFLWYVVCEFLHVHSYLEMLQRSFCKMTTSYNWLEPVMLTSQPAISHHKPVKSHAIAPCHFTTIKWR